MNITLDTTSSDLFHSKWAQNPNSLNRTSITRQQDFSTSPGQVFPLLCPTTEYDWLPGWSCELLHSDSGYTEYNVIFRTTFFGPEEIWVCTRFEPNKCIEYARFSKDLCGKMEINLVDLGNNKTRGVWVVSASALSLEGARAVDDLEAAGNGLAKILSGLEQYLVTGKMVK